MFLRVFLEQKKPRQLGGVEVRAWRSENSALSPAFGEEGRDEAYSRIVRMSPSNWLRRWVKRAAAAPLITR